MRCGRWSWAKWVCQLDAWREWCNRESCTMVPEGHAVSCVLADDCRFCTHGATMHHRGRMRRMHHEARPMAVG
jgi:hypothetical protein